MAEVPLPEDEDRELESMMSDLKVKRKKKKKEEGATKEAKPAEEKLAVMDKELYAKLLGRI